MSETAALAGISRQALHVYKKKFFEPALQQAAQLHSLQEVASLDNVKAQTKEDLTRSILTSSQFRLRLEHLWGTTNEVLDKAKNAVREIKDTNGNVVAIAQDLSAVAPLLNQAHKNVEMLGKALGELEHQPTAQVAIQIVMPQAMPSAAALVDDSPVIDIALPLRR